MPTDPYQLPGILEIAWRGGLLLALLYFIWAGSTKRIVWGYQLEDEKKERDDLRTEYEERLDKMAAEIELWRNLALEGRDLVKSAVNVAETRSK